MWKHFTIAEDNSFAICKHCQKEVPLGGKCKKSYNTTSLVNHLKEHCESFKIYNEDKTTRAKKATGDKQRRQTLRQFSLEEANEKVKKWSIHDVRSERLHCKLGEMVAMDCQPYPIVEDTDFKGFVTALESRYHLPSRKFLVENIIPRIKTGLECELQVCLSDVHCFSFTTDAWTTNISNLNNNQDVTTEILKEKYHAQVSAASDKTEQPPSQQEMSTNQEKQYDLWESVTEMLEESGVNFIGEVNELSCYLDEPLIDVRKEIPTNGGTITCHNILY